MTNKHFNRAPSWSLGAAGLDREQTESAIAWNLSMREQIQTHLVEAERAVEMMSVTIQQSQKRIALSHQLLKRRPKSTGSKA